jgi:hypothetical protein
VCLSSYLFGNQITTLPEGVFHNLTLLEEM